MNMQPIRLRIVERDARVLMVHEAPQRCGNGGEQFLQVERGDNRVIDLQDETQAVAFLSELFLTGLGLLEIERIVYGKGHLFGDLLQKLDLGLRIDSGLRAAECQRTHSSHCCRESDQTKGFDAAVVKPCNPFRKAALPFFVGEHPGLLALADGLRRRFHRALRRRAGVSRVRGFEHVGHHFLLFGVIKNHVDEFKVDGSMQWRGEIMEQLRQIAIR